MAMMLMISVEYWSWRGLWTLPSEVVWTLERTRPSTVGPQPSHIPPTPEECDSLLRFPSCAGAEVLRVATSQAMVSTEQLGPVL